MSEKKTLLQNVRVANNIYRNKPIIAARLFYCCSQPGPSLVLTEYYKYSIISLVEWASNKSSLMDPYIDALFIICL